MANDSPSWETLLQLMKKTPLDVLAAVAASTPVHSGLQNADANLGSGGSPTPDVPVHSGLPSQITKPTTEDISAMKEIGEKAAAAQDGIADLLDPINKQVKELKERLMGEIAARVEELETALDQNSDELLRRMMSHGLKAIRVSDRPPIEVITKKDKSLTQKELFRILGKPEGLRVWNSIEEKEKHSLKIPKPTPPEA